jgi:hypothetical protein
VCVNPRLRDEQNFAEVVKEEGMAHDVGKTSTEAARN